MHTMRSYTKSYVAQFIFWPAHTKNNAKFSLNALSKFPAHGSSRKLCIGGRPCDMLYTRNCMPYTPMLHTPSMLAFSYQVYCNHYTSTLHALSTWSLHLLMRAHCLSPWRPSMQYLPQVGSPRNDIPRNLVHGGCVSLLVATLRKAVCVQDKYVCALQLY